MVVEFLGEIIQIRIQMQNPQNLTRVGEHFGIAVYSESEENSLRKVFQTQELVKKKVMEENSLSGYSDGISQD